MTDKKQVLKLLKKMGISYTTFDKEEYIHGDGVNAGSVSTLYIGNSIDLHFNKKEKYIGSSNDCIGSFIKRKRSKK